ncbi:lactonase family protein [Krasilnikoviella flava]|uniref:6-phosphogluconolactonase, cycloisomerase 2 family n=1 Tax=Krasilnikoviella flava TaxID=526729 RepID=A0A1T5IK76_9MICO|nr:beta-propeller fold lactonase family protein [Krasilnikoviella flava]SKC39520.1 6-phosphogluconolactonase, cycloisomerase 2 family [Krasilnikoviella flava]
MTERDALTQLWVGTYPKRGGAAGSGESIWRVALTPDGAVASAVPAVAATSPSFLALHPTGRTLYAVAETPAGTLSAFRVEAADDGSDDGVRLAPSGAVASGGDEPCHVLSRGDAVWVANYGDGVAASVDVDPATGDLAAEGVVAHPGVGTGPVVERQAGPHAHFVADSGDDVLVCDLGADVVRRYPAAGAEPGTAAEIAAVLPPGTGPRHLVMLPDGSLVVVGELDARVHLLVRDGDGWSPAAAVPVSPVAEAGRDYPAHVTLSADGARLHVGLRGADVLAVLRVVPAESGAPVLEHLADVPLGDGAWPRHHAVLSSDGADGAETVVVALQDRSELATVRLDPATGAGEVVARHALPTPPACVLES